MRRQFKQARDWFSEQLSCAWSKTDAVLLRHRMRAVWLGAALVALVAYYIAWPDNFDQRLRTLTAIGAGISALVLLINVSFTSKAVENSQRTLEHQERSQQAQRFFDAAKMLGDKSIDARIGALYSLGQLGQDSDLFYDQIVNVLCAFVRRRSEDERPVIDVIDHAEKPQTHQDIEVAMTILANRRKRLGDGEQRGLDLRRANLCSMHFTSADFQESNLTEALMIGTSFNGGNLAGAKMRKADLRASGFRNTVLVNASFVNSDVRGAVFYNKFELRDPNGFIAEGHVDGLPPNEAIRYTRPTTEVGIQLVAGGRYLDGTVWVKANLDGTKFMDEDLSGLKGMSTQQYARTDHPRVEKHPQLLAVDDNRV